MNNSEFDVIKKYFSFPSVSDDVITAGGDDCAVVSVPTGKKLLITTDTLIAGVHFPVETSAEDIAHKALMVNLSDLAAMGAKPTWVTLAITLPDVDEKWLSSFSQQLSKVLTEFNVSLIGGDTTKGALSITIQAMGLCDEQKILKRDQARQGDKIFVTSYLGDASIGLRALRDNLNDVKLSSCVEKLNRPTARIFFAEKLTKYSRCAIDISDGLVADLGHIVDASQCGAHITLAESLLSPAAQYYFERYNNNIVDWSIVLAHGDDYELCFTVGTEHEQAVQKLADKHQLKLICIGEITDSKKLDFFTDDNCVVEFSNTGFKHF